MTTTVSLFCGAGGESAGKELAFRDLGVRTVDMLSHAGRPHQGGGAPAACRLRAG